MKKTVLLLAAILNLSACSLIYDQDPRNLSTSWKDNQITVKIAGLKNQLPDASDLRVNAFSYNGNVVLVGQSRTLELKNTLLEKIRVLEGVQKVYDQIHIKAPIEFNQRSRDTWITTKIKSVYLTNKQLLNANIKVVTEDSQVFLFGYVSPEQANIATEIARNAEGVDRVIQAWF